MTPEDFKSPEATPADRPKVARRESKRRDAGIRWVRPEFQVAARIAPSDLMGRLRSGLEIQPGTRALLFVGGRYVGTLPPGRHTIEGLKKKVKIPTEGEPVAVVVDDGDLGLEFEVGGLHSADHHNVSLFSQVSLRLSEPEVFLANLMRDRPVFTVEDLAMFLSGEIRQSLRELVIEHQAEDLYRGRVRSRLEMELLSNWKATLDRCGFVLNRFRVLRFDVSGLEMAEDVRSMASDSMAMKEAFFETEMADFNLDTLIFDRKEEAAEERRRLEVDHEIEQTKIEAERLERRQAVFERLLQGGVLEKMAELKSEEEWRKFRLQVDRDRLLDDHEWEELKKDTEARAEQADVTRHFVFLRVKAMAEADLEELRLKRAYQLKILEMRGDAEVVEESLKTERMQLEAQLANRRKVFEADMTERDREFEQSLGRQRSEADLQLWKVERLETIRQMGKDRKAARELQLKVTEAEAERKRVAAVGDVMLGKTEDEILAMAIALNPDRAEEIGKAFEAKNAGKMTERERALYERMMDEIKEAKALDHEKFEILAETGAMHRGDYRRLDEREKDRAERIATAGLTRGADLVHRHENVNAPESDVWQYCEIHDLKFKAGGRCPLCGSER